MNIKKRVEELGLVLPNVSSPGGSYKSVNVRQNIAYVAIQFPIRDEEYLYQGRLGHDITTAEGAAAMQLCALNVIAQLEAKVGFDKILGLNHMEACYQCNDLWDEGPTIADGASELFTNILGEKGQHSRSIFSVHKLPRNFCAGLTLSASLV